MKATVRKFTRLCSAVALMAAGAASVQATTINWAGYSWTISPYAIGGGQVSGNDAETWIDSRGYLHMDMSKIGSTWYGSEVATTTNHGFGTYYWVWSGPFTSLEKQAVIGAFTYGPQGGIGADGENEIDVEFSKWNVTGNQYNGDFTIYPSTGHGGSNANINWTYTGGTTCTCRVDWNSTSITESIWSGVVPINASTSSANVTWTHTGTTTNMPQAAVPYLFNVWSYGVKPTKAVDITIQTFQFVPQGSSVPATPTGLSASAGNTQATLTWNPSAGATSYNLYRGWGSGNESATPIATGLTGTSKTDTGLTNGVTYDYKVAAVNSAGTSGLSNEAAATPVAGNSNIAPSGTGYLWSKNASATSAANQAASIGVNDGNLTTLVNVNPTGEGGAANYEGAGVIWSTTHTVSSANFINGGDDGYGNGFFQANAQLQFTTNGTTWTNSGWTLSPAYPNSSAAWGHTYTFSGTAVSGVKGARVVGQLGGTSYGWTVNEVQVIGQ